MTQEPGTIPGQYDEIDLMDILLVLARRWRRIFASGLLCAALAAGGSYLVTPEFTTWGHFIPVAQESLISPSTIPLLSRSFPLIDRATDSIGLTEKMGVTRKDEAFLRRIRDAITVFEEKNTPIMTISVRLPDPVWAADLAKAILSEIEKEMVALHGKLLAEVQEKKKMLEVRLAEADKDLDQAERAVQQVAASYKAAPGVMEVFDRYRRGEADLNTSLLATLPDGGAAFFSAVREMKKQEGLYAPIFDQYNRVIQQEQAHPPKFQIVETPYPPEKRSKPRRALMTILGGVLGLFIGVAGAFLGEFTRSAEDDPERAAKLRELREHLSLRRPGR